jgi:hypothetical protein
LPSSQNSTNEVNKKDRNRFPRKHVLGITALAILIVGTVIFNVYVVGRFFPTQTATLPPLTSYVTSASGSSSTIIQLRQILVLGNAPDNLSDVPHYCDYFIGCAYHWHVHLDIFVNSASYIPVPANLGHINNSTSNLYAIHAHDYSGIVHLECCSPSANQVFTLGQIFEVWGYPNFDSNDCLNYSNQAVSVYVDGNLWSSGPIASIPLKNHLEIAVVIGSAPPPPIPSTYAFPPGY